MPKKVGKKGHFAQIEDSAKLMLPPARLRPTSLGKEAIAPSQPATIEVSLTRFVTNS
jgi:hypothetical protein